jgi:hypothetical protein
MIRRPGDHAACERTNESLLRLSTFLCLVAQAVGLAASARAQPYVNQAQVHANESSKAYCTRLTSFYDWFGAGRSEARQLERNALPGPERASQ